MPLAVPADAEPWKNTAGSAPGPGSRNSALLKTPPSLRLTAYRRRGAKRQHVALKVSLSSRLTVNHRCPAGKPKHDVIKAPLSLRVTVNRRRPAGKSKHGAVQVPPFTPSPRLAAYRRPGDQFSKSISDRLRYGYKKIHRSVIL